MPVYEYYCQKCDMECKHPGCFEPEKMMRKMTDSRKKNGRPLFSIHGGNIK